MNKREICVSSTRSITSYLNQGISPVKNTFHFRPGEQSKFLLPIMGCVGVAGLYSLPSVTYTILTESVLPEYALEAAFMGTLIGGAWVAYGRWTNDDSNIAKNPKDDSAYVALVRLNGEISSGMRFKREGSFSAETTIPLLQKAFEDKKAKGVVIQINSHGGSPVQSALIHDEIIKLKAKHKKKVVILGEDYMASGAYYIAVSADKIYVNTNTITGSIGVAIDGYGYVELGKKIGVESRTYTAGENKRRLNPLKPESEGDVKKIKQTLEEIHDDFKTVVLKGRAGKLKQEDHNELFSGDAWTGKKALKFGLIDELGTLTDLLEKEFQVTAFKEIKKNWLGDVSFLKHLDSIMTPTVELSLKLPTSENRVQLKM